MKTDNGLKEANTKTLEEKVTVLIDRINECLVSNEIHKAREYAFTALKLTDNILNKDYKIKILNLLGICNVSFNQYSKSLEYYHEAVLLSRKAENSVLISQTLNNIAYVYGTIKNSEKALTYYLEALEYDKNNFRSLNSAATIYLNMGEYASAEPLLQKAHDISVKENQIRSLTISLINMAFMEQCRKNFSASYAHLEKAKTIIDKTNDPIMKVYYYLQAGETSQADQKMPEALVFFKEAFRLAQQIEDKNLRFECYKIMKKYYEALKDYKKAYEYSCKENELRETLFNEELNSKIAGLNASYEVSQKELKARQLMEKSSKLFSIGVMATGITHEINQPLNAISVCANSVMYWHNKNLGVLPELIIEEVEQIVEGAERIDKIIKHMRSFWANTDEDTQHENFDLNEQVNLALSLVERQLYAHGIVLVNEVGTDKYPIVTSRVNIDQIIINLVNNAMHSLDESNHANKTVIVKTGKINGFYHIWIEDNGIGLPQDFRNKIFDPFYSTKKPGKGMGLGLAIVVSLLEKMRGSISAENSEKGGACFTVMIPEIIEEKNEDIVS